MIKWLRKKVFEVEHKKRMMDLLLYGQCFTFSFTRPWWSPARWILGREGIRNVSPLKMVGFKMPKEEWIAGLVKENEKLKKEVEALIDERTVLMLAYKNKGLFL